MAMQPLTALPVSADVFIDANIFIYGLSGKSMECKKFLSRCATEEIFGFSLYEVVNEATHHLMTAEACKKGLIKSPSTDLLRKKFHVIPALVDYWEETKRILNLNLGFVANERDIVLSAHPERQAACLRTNDSMIVSCMRTYGITNLASNDSEFDRVVGIVVYKPSDVVS